MTEIQASVDEEAKQHLKLLFIFQKIADDRGIEVTEEEVNSRVARMAALYRRRPERLRQELESDGTLLQVRVAIREEKVTAQLLRQAKITDPTGQAVEETPDEETADEEKAEAETPGEASEEETTQ
jgi:trigger factor